MYYMDSGMAQICAFQDKVKMDENYQEAWNSYVAFCRLAASDFFENMVEEVGLDSPFKEGTIQKLVNHLEDLLNGN